MYYPIQVPYILNTDFSRHVSYTETTLETLKDFVICLWEMKPKTKKQVTANHVIVTDGCIDLVVGYDDREIIYAGMSTTAFHDIINVPNRFFGVRLKPGAFEQLTGLPATKAMDVILPIKHVDSDFDMDVFFALSFDDAKIAFREYLEKLVCDKKPNEFVSLFDRFSLSPPAEAAELYEALHLSPRQCQRNFIKHFGLTPQMVLSILRFQRCLALLTSKEATPNEILETTTYYDQSHFIKDFKKNIGLTPFEYLNTQKMSHIYNTDAKELVTLDTYKEIGGNQRMNTKMIEKANAHIQKTSNVNLGVIDENGYPVVMAMSLINPKDISEIYLSTTPDSNKAKSLKKNNKASICCSTNDYNITLVGEIEIMTDQETKSKCWQNWFIEVYPDGETDPNYCVLKFKTKRAALYIDDEVAAFEM